MTRADNEIPSLYGLRAVSILFVMFAHVLGFSRYPNWVRFLFQHGDMGVRIFFIISGYLITTLLLRERQRFGAISLKLFYFRRILRIFPAFYLFVGAIVVLWFTNVISLPRNNIAFMLTYTINFARDGTWVTGHLWSLSVEEQFYLLWPLAMRFTNRVAWIAIAVFAVFAGIIVRTVDTLVRVQIIDPALRYATPFVAGPIAMGCLLALCSPTPFLWKRIVNALRGFWLFGAILLVLFLDGIDLGTANRFIALLTNAILTLLVARFVMVPTDGFGQFLNAKPMVLLGKLSYSLYLWQQLFLNPYSTWRVSQFPINVIATVLAASGSYLLMERPLLKYRKQWRRTARPISASTDES